LHGVANAGTATVFPEPIGLAATFDTPLIHEMAIVIGTEVRAKHNQAVRQGRRDIMEGLDFWSPNVNIFRDPRWGRGQETYGEDPFLTGRMGIAFVTGLQGDDPKYFRVISTPEHFAVHSGPEPSRHAIDVQVSKHDMEDTYLPAFRATVTEGKAESIMCAYNRVNGQPACATEHQRLALKAAHESLINQQFGVPVTELDSAQMRSRKREEQRWKGVERRKTTASSGRLGPWKITLLIDVCWLTSGAIMTSLTLTLTFKL
jgi:hypothetical protein